MAPQVLAEIKIDGMKELNAKFRRLGLAIRKKALRRAAREGGKLVAEKAERNLKTKITEQTGFTAENIKVRVTQPNPFDVVSIIKPIALQAHFIEQGFLHVKSGRHIPAKPYLRPAITTSFRQVVTIVQFELDKVVQRAQK